MGIDKRFMLMSQKMLTDLLGSFLDGLDWSSSDFPSAGCIEESGVGIFIS